MYKYVFVNFLRIFSYFLLIMNIFLTIFKKLYDYSYASFFIPHSLLMNCPNNAHSPNKTPTTLVFNEVLSQHIWDLYYHTLAEFVRALSKVEPYKDLCYASDKIQLAWQICEKYIDPSHPSEKHQSAESILHDLWGIETLSNRFSQLSKDHQRAFLLQLATKLRNDGVQDAQRPSIKANWVVDATKKRTKLAGALLEASLAIKKVYIKP